MKKKKSALLSLHWQRVEARQRARNTILFVYTIEKRQTRAQHSHVRHGRILFAFSSILPPPTTTYYSTTDNNTQCSENNDKINIMKNNAEEFCKIEGICISMYKNLLAVLVLLPHNMCVLSASTRHEIISGKHRYNKYICSFIFTNVHVVRARRPNGEYTTIKIIAYILTMFNLILLITCGQCTMYDRINHEAIVYVLYPFFSSVSVPHTTHVHRTFFECI